MIVWTDYLKYRANLREYSLSTIENILRYSEERYIDRRTGRSIVIGRHEEQLVMIPYDKEGDTMIPVTIHATNRQQINFRLKSGRFGYE